MIMDTISSSRKCRNVKGPSNFIGRPKPAISVPKMQSARTKAVKTAIRNHGLKPALFLRARTYSIVAKTMTSSGTGLDMKIPVTSMTEAPSNRVVLVSPTMSSRAASMAPTAMRTHLSWVSFSLELSLLPEPNIFMNRAIDQPMSSVVTKVETTRAIIGCVNTGWKRVAAAMPIR